MWERTVVWFSFMKGSLVDVDYPQEYVGCDLEEKARWGWCVRRVCAGGSDRELGGGGARQTGGWKD